jgi:hypothetical protein
MRTSAKGAMRLAAALAAALGICGCGSGVESVQDPRTGQTETCTGPGMNDLSPWSDRDACLADHVAQGWTVKMMNRE